MIEKDFDIPFIADLALREKQIQQNYRSIRGAPVVYTTTVDAVPGRLLKRRP
jgi:hypothetical protein